jgi:peptide/nickel transport system substrate-binding protein
MVSKRRWSRGIAASVLLACLLAAGVGATTAGASPARAHARDARAAVAGPTFVYSAYTQVMINWDPATAYDQEGVAMQNMYESLTRYDTATRTIEPLLATKWKQSKDGKTWTFTLRKGVTFHDGNPFTSQAAKAAIMRTKKLNQGAAYIWGAVTSIATPAPTTLIFHLKYPEQLALITSSSPGAYMYDTKAAGSQDLVKWFNAGHDAGTGPYTVKTAAPGSEVELVADAYPKYWGGWSGSHYSAVEYRIVREDSTTAQLLHAGQVTFAQKLNPQIWTTFKGQSGFQTPTSSSFQNVLMYLNTATGPLKNILVRRAISQAIDYNGIVTALKGAAVREGGIIPSGLFGHSKVPEYQYNTDAAKKLMTQSGQSHVTLNATYTQGDSNEELITTIMKSDLAKIGITLNVQALTTSTKYAKARSTTPSSRQDITFIYWYPDYPDAATWFISLLHTQSPPSFNFAYYSNKALDKQIDSVTELTATNPTTAKAVYHSMEMTVYRDVPLIPIYAVETQRVLLSSVKGYVDDPSYPDVVFVYQLHPSS